MARNNRSEKNQKRDLEQPLFLSVAVETPTTAICIFAVDIHAAICMYASVDTVFPESTPSVGNPAVLAATSPSNAPRILHNFLCLMHSRWPTAFANFYSITSHNSSFECTFLLPPVPRLLNLNISAECLFTLTVKLPPAAIFPVFLPSNLGSFFFNPSL